MYRGNRKKRKVIIFSLVGILLCMVVGYAAFSQTLNISGTSKVVSSFDVKFKDIYSTNIVGQAKDLETPSLNSEKTIASFKAGLYAPGDSITYDVTIRNNGTLSAIIKLLNYTTTASENIDIVSSGVREGQVIHPNEEKHLYITVSFDEDFEGTDLEETVDIDISADFEQATGDEPVVGDNYVVTYDSKTNGGIDENQTEETAIGDNINLSKAASREGYAFVGWNTDKNAKTGMTEYKMPDQDITVYAIFSKTLTVTYQKNTNVASTGKTSDNCNIFNHETSCQVTLPSITPNTGYVQDGWYNGQTKIGNVSDKYTITSDVTLTANAIEDVVSLTVSTTATTNSITVIANANATSGISKYEYNINNSAEWIDGGTENTHTFTNLTQNQLYDIKVRVTTASGKVETASTAETTTTIPQPTFAESGVYPKTVTVTTPEGCGTTLTCTYEKTTKYPDGTVVDTPQTITATETPVEFDYHGNLVVTISDGTNTSSVSLEVEIELKASDLSFDKTKTELPCEDAQCALDELKKLLN